MNIESELRQFISTHLSADVRHVDRDCNLWTEGYLDSTAILELILWLESKFNVTIQNEDLTPENFATLRNIEEFVQRGAGTQMASNAAAELG